MLGMERHPLHIKNPELQTSEEVQDAVEKKQRLTHERIPNDPAERIEAYMDRLEKIFLNKDERVRTRNLELLKDKIYDALIIKSDNFPESYFDLQKRIARERGQAVEEIPPNVREQMMDVAIQDQKASLDAWIDYLTEEDVAYPTWFKYFVWRNVTKLSQFDKERGEFKKRADSTVARYPDIHRGALAQILDIYQKVKEDDKNLKEPEIREMFSKKFPTLYAELISQSLEASMEDREELHGQWVQFKHGNDKGAEKLFESMQGKGTGWCVEGRTTAHSYIKQGDFYVYYTNDKQGKPTQPRLAIQMSGNQIGQIRGILPHQNVEPAMEEVLNAKLQEFGPEADSYRKKSEDMKKLTQLEHKQEKDQPFTQDDLTFLCEINQPIEGFGYQRDPRIKELRQHRNPEADMLTIFECTKDQVANVPTQISENTKAYLGQLEPGVFTKLQQFNVEHVFTSFPEGKITKYHIEIGGKTKQQLKEELKNKNIQIGNYAQDLLNSKDFITSKTIEGTDLVRLTVKDLGFPSGATTQEIYQRAQDLGLEFCPAEVGPHLRLNYTGSELIIIGMKQIFVRGGSPGVFYLYRYADGLWLRTYDAEPSGRWDSRSEFVFRLRPPLAGKQVK